MTPPWGNLKDHTPMSFAKSVFQKAIRQGEPEEVGLAMQAIRNGTEAVALYFARELYNAGQETWLWRRLLTISGEDIGIADLSVTEYIVNLVMSQNVAWRLIGKSKHMDGKPGHEDLMPLFNAVLVCCRAKKSRAADNAAIWFNLNPTWRPPVLTKKDVEIEKPKWCGKKVKVLMRYVRRYAKTGNPTIMFLSAALDKHVPGTGNGLAHFLEYGAKLTNKSDVVDFTPPTDAD